jgi:hypothetical protein
MAESSARIPKLPGRSNRIVLIGRTGTGKTVCGLWHLSNQDLTYPWVLLNFKNDEHLDSIANVEEIDLDWKPNKKSRGLYMLRPLPPDMKSTRIGPSRLETFLWRVWAHEKVGTFCDETFMVGENEAFDTLLTQGRSKKCPMIMCTQRPVWITRFAFSEASFIQCFDLNDQDDIRRVEEFMPLLWDEEKPLGPHQSWYYEIDRNMLYRMQPCPPMPEIRRAFAEKLPRKVRVL